MKIDWKLPDKKGFAVAFAAAVSVFVLPGCLEQIVKVKTPDSIVDKGYADVYPVADVDFYQEKYRESVEAEFGEWQYSEDKGRETVRKWSGVIDYASDPTTIAGFAVDPVGAGLSLISFITGLGFRRREDASPTTLRKEKEDSYNEGLKQGVALKQSVQ